MVKPNSSYKATFENGHYAKFVSSNTMYRVTSLEQLSVAEFSGE